MKEGDVVRREFYFGTGDKTIEGVIVQADYHKSNQETWLRIAVDGDLNHINLSPASKCEKSRKRLSCMKMGK